MKARQVIGLILFLATVVGGIAYMIITDAKAFGVALLVMFLPVAWGYLIYRLIED